MRRHEAGPKEATGPSPCSAHAGLCAQHSPRAELQSWLCQEEKDHTGAVGGGGQPFPCLLSPPFTEPLLCLVFLLAAIMVLFIKLVKSLMMPGCAAGLRLNPQQ